MKIEILQNDEWVNVLVVDAKTFPTVKVLHDPGHSGYIALKQFNSRIASLRINGDEGRYGIEFDEVVCFEAGKVGYCHLSVGEAVTIPPGTKVYLHK